MRPTPTSLVLAALFAVSCQDPVHDQAVAALGPEKRGVEEGPTHRPGQPCLTCHGGSGPGEPEWSIAGTVFADPRGDAPASRIAVRVSDATGAERLVQSNSAGNFYIAKKEWDPVFPLKVQLESEGRVIPMHTRVGGTGGCGSCHRDARRGGADGAHVSAVYWE